MSRSLGIIKKRSLKGGHCALITLKQIANVDLPTHWADFRLLAFEGTHTNSKTKERRLETALAIVLGDIHSSPPVVRIHSQCTTGEVFHSLRCDCHDQLHLALHAIAQEGAGILLYEQQEGRGIGLMEKLRAYQLQDQGLNTIEANLRLGHAVDLRDYVLAVEVLKFLKIRSLRLLTNNPEKIEAVIASGIEIVERLSADVPGNPHSDRYLAIKREQLGHLSNSDSVRVSLPDNANFTIARLEISDKQMAVPIRSSYVHLKKWSCGIYRVTFSVGAALYSWCCSMVKR